MVAPNEKAYLGAIQVSVKVPDITLKGREQLRRFRREMRLAHEAGLNAGVEVLRTILSAKKYFDTGTLRDSVARRLFVKTTDIFTGDVHFNSPGKEYAYFVEHGRGPGRVGDDGRRIPPPFDKMVSWGERHGLSFEKTMAIRNKIAYHGVKARPFMAKAEREITKAYNSIVNKAVRQFKKENR